MSSDAPAPPRDSPVFEALDEFDAPHHPPVDPDAMDRMLLNLAASSDPNDWTLDALAPDPDFYPATHPAHNPYPSLPLHYIDANTPAPAPAPPHHNHHDPALQVSLDAPRPSSEPSAPLPKSPPQPLPDPTVNVHTGSPSSVPSQKRPASSHPKSPAHSGSSAKPRIPTARCSLCGKSISTNGANFRRHEQACRRQRADRVSAARPPSSPLVVVNQQQQHLASQPPKQSQPFSAALPQQQQPQQHQSQPQQNQTSGGLSRRDSDLLNVVRRLESSISTLDVSARLCLRDALISLSNKASNPHVPPTPEQEAMNRAAEYLVLRMLFLSGQQVMHTAPGTAGASYPSDAQAASSSVQGMASRSPQADRDIAMSSGRGSGEDDDGTVAASTGTGGVTIAKQESAVGERSPLRPSGKIEDKLADGT